MIVWHACEILNALSGRPSIVLSGALDEWFAVRGWSAHVSLSDESEYAVAFVVIESSSAI